jgi:hypothetical protein
MAGVTGHDGSATAPDTTVAGDTEKHVESEALRRGFFPRDRCVLSEEVGK